MARIERYGNGETAMRPSDTESAKRTLRRTRNNHTDFIQNGTQRYKNPQVKPPKNYSHSIVAGGLEVMS